MNRFIYPVDLNGLRSSCISERGNSMSITLIWVAWGEFHVHEALASACMASAVNSCNPNLKYHVHLLGQPASVSQQILQVCEANRVEVFMSTEQAPTNPALYDRMRMEKMAATGGPTVYVDSDVYCLAPFDLMRLTSSPMRTFSMGIARAEEVSCHHHGIVDEVLGASSSTFYADEGLGIEDYRSKADFWPYLRYNLGLVYVSGDQAFQKFAEAFISNHSLFPSFRWFGTGELIFQAMINAGEAPWHRCDWQSGYAPMFPLVRDSMFEIAVRLVDGIRVSEIRCDPRFPVLHVGHFSRVLYDKLSPDDRPISITMQKDGQVRIIMISKPRTIEASLNGMCFRRL